MEVSKRDIFVSLIAGLILVAVLVPSLVFVNNEAMDVTEENDIQSSTIEIIATEQTETATETESETASETASDTASETATVTATKDSEIPMTDTEIKSDEKGSSTKDFQTSTKENKSSVDANERSTVRKVNTPDSSPEISQPDEDNRTSEVLEDEVSTTYITTDKDETTTLFEVRNPKLVQVSNFKLGLSQPKEETVSERVKRILSTVPLIDGHNDFPESIREHAKNDVEMSHFGCDLTKLEPWASDSTSHTDLRRLRKGMVGGQFWSAYAGCDTQYTDAVQKFLEQIDVIHQLVRNYPDDLQWADSADGIESAFKSGKIASLVGVESGHAIGSSLAVLRTLYEAGARYMTLTHSCNTPWADAAQSESGDFPAENKGISKFGEKVVLEMNRLGMMVDLAHVSSDTMRDALNVSKAPVIFSHSGARAVSNNVRNVPDDVLEMIKIKGGIVMANFYSCYIIDDCHKNNATIDDVVKHINHIRKVAGVDHVGIGGDYNGVTILPIGLEDVSGFPKVFEALINDKTFEWTDDDLEKLASRNILGVFRAVESVRDGLAQTKVDNTWIDPQDFNGKTGCRTGL